MTDNTELKRLAEAAILARNEYIADECNCDLADEQTAADDAFHDAAGPEEVLALIAENDALKGPHDWLAEDLIKELVDNAQAIQENADDGEEDQFVTVLLAAASRIRRQEANIEKLKADAELSAKTADCWDRLNIQNKALSDSFRAERDQLGAEIAGLKTGYEAYERVNAELKLKVANLEVCQTASLGMSGIIKCVAGELGFDAAGEDSAQDYLIGLARKASDLKAENEVLRKAALEAREFILHEAEVRGLLDENNEVSFRHPRRQAAIASIDAAMGKGERP